MSRHLRWRVILEAVLLAAALAWILLQQPPPVGAPAWLPILHR